MNTSGDASGIVKSNEEDTVSYSGSRALVAKRTLVAGPSRGKLILDSNVASLACSNA